MEGQPSIRTGKGRCFSDCESWGLARDGDSLLMAVFGADRLTGADAAYREEAADAPVPLYRGPAFRRQLHLPRGKSQLPPAAACPGRGIPQGAGFRRSGLSRGACANSPVRGAGASPPRSTHNRARPDTRRHTENGLSDAAARTLLLFE